jgi:hypothetical protein
VPQSWGLSQNQTLRTIPSSANRFFYESKTCWNQTRSYDQSLLSIGIYWSSLYCWRCAATNKFQITLSFPKISSVCLFWFGMTIYPFNQYWKVFLWSSSTLINLSGLSLYERSISYTLTSEALQFVGILWSSKNWIANFPFFDLVFLRLFEVF